MTFRLCHLIGPAGRGHSRKFFRQFEKQDGARCGPASLAFCLAMFGHDQVTQHVLTNRLRVSADRLNKEGFSETDMSRAADLYAVETRACRVAHYQDFDTFVRNIDVSLFFGRPVILMVWDFQHWLTVVGKVRNRYVIYDSAAVFKGLPLWTRGTLKQAAWNKCKDCPWDEEESIYYGLFFYPKDKLVNSWKVTEGFGYACTHKLPLAGQVLRRKLIKVSTLFQSPCSVPRVVLSGVVAVQKECLLEGLLQALTPREAKAFLEEVQIIGESCGITVSSNYDAGRFVRRLVRLGKEVLEHYT